MARCFISGLEISVSSSFVLDVVAARRLERELRQKAAALRKMIEMLGKMDKVQHKDAETGHIRTRRERRLLCKVVANGLNAAWKDHGLFIGLNSYLKRINRHKNNSNNSNKIDENFKKNQISDNQVIKAENKPTKSPESNENLEDEKNEKS